MDHRSMLVIAAVIIYLLLQPATANDADDTGWLTPLNITLYWGEQVVINGYTITAQDFSPSKPVDLPDDYVMLNVKSNTSRSWGAILALNNTMIPNETILDGSVKLTAKKIITGNNIPTPYAIIEVAFANISSVSKPIPWINSVVRVKKSPINEAYVYERVNILIEVISLKDISLENIHINETVPDGFITDPDIEDTCWTISLRPGEKRLLSYSVRALRPGTFLIPGMQMSFDHNGVTHHLQTNASKIVIHGPYIDVNKSFIYQDMGIDGLLNVTLRINNTGDRAAYVQLADQMPENCQLLSGNLNKSQVMQPSDVWVLEYSVLVHSRESVVIPGAKVRFADSREYRDSFESASYLLKIQGNIIEEDEPEEDMVQEQTSAETGVETKDKMVPEKINSVNSLKRSLINLVEKAIGWRS